MSYISLSEKDRQEMLARIGVRTADELFGGVPGDVRLKRDLKVPGPLAELELIRKMESMAAKNSSNRLLSFLGGGAYAHFIPTVVDYLSQRGEFVSPYTPYQPEVSQGTLQAIFEYQTLVCQLTGLDVANASLYEGATAAAEAVLMAQRVKSRNRVLLARTLHPEYRETIRTYIKNLGIEAVEVPFTSAGTLDAAALARLLNDATCAVVVQSPNFFGVCEDLKAVADAAHKQGALAVAVVAEALSLGLLESPGRLGMDIACGEAQSFGLPLSFGGPYLGFMASRQDYVRQLPGRLCGQTTDVEGQRGFVLTLSTREQHIRRERATSNICTNQALCALRATIFLETLGQEGLRELAWQNVQKAAYAADAVEAVRGARKRFAGPVFNEFVVEFSKPWPAVDTALRTKGILAGLPLERDYPELSNTALICVTELRSKEEIDRLAQALKEVLR
jgi:glycine dehydrogenase subunit 1